MKLIFLLLFTGDHPNSRANGIAEEDEVIPSVRTFSFHLIVNFFYFLFEISCVISCIQLMGLEECDEKDVACQNRRMLADAHLDYIYTQQHKP